MFSFTVYRTRHLVLDEADKMLGIEYEKELTHILSLIDKKTCQIQLYSATMTKKVEKLQKAHLKDPVKIQIATSKYSTVSTLIQEYLFIPEKYKEVYLSYLLNEVHVQILLFIYMYRMLESVFSYLLVKT